MERRLALMAGAGEIPGQVAAEARRQGWRVVAFTLGDEVPGLAGHAEEVITVSVTDIQAVLAPLAARSPAAAVFCGTLSKQKAFTGGARTDPLGQHLMARGLGDAALRQTVVTVLESMGIEVLDQRRFLAAWLMTAPSLTARAPSPAEWDEVRAGLKVARALAAFDVGQTVVQARGVTVAVEAIEGTDEAIRRGTRLAGPGAVIVKGIGLEHDYRFDVPAVGPSTIGAAADGKASVLAVERGRVMLIRGDDVVRQAEQAGIALVSVDGDG